MAKLEIDKIRLYATCFTTGMVILILEILGFRLFAPFYGYTVYVSGTLIGIILTCLSVGYYIGGMAADKWPNEKYVYYIIFSSTIYLIVMYLFYNLVLKTFQNLGMIAGTVTTAAIIYGFPMVLLSMVSPYLIKLLSMRENVGMSSGSIFSVSTVGSILGTFLATFVLIPFVGTSKTFALCLILLIVILIFGLASIKNKLAIPCVFLAFFPCLPQYSIDDNHLLYKTESAYNLIRIYENSGIRYMTLNDPLWIQSYRPNIPNSQKFFSTYREFFNLAPCITGVKKVLVLGMSAGASVVELDKYFDVEIDAIELDPKVIQLAEEYFNVKETEKIKIYADDARNFIARTNKQYDFIEIDLFCGGPEIPFYVATKEFFTKVYKHTTGQGIVMMNLVGTVENEKTNSLVMAISNTFAAIFPKVYLFQIGNNTLLLATKNETEMKDIVASLGEIKRPFLKVFGDKMASSLVEYKYDPDVMIFTDDKAPVEYVMRNTLKNLE